MWDIAIAFVLLPCLGAVIAGWGLADWRLAGIAVCAGLAVLLVAGFLPASLRLFGLPLVSGALVGAVSMVAVLYLRPDANVWSRMTIAMMAAFAVHMLHLYAVLG